MMMLQRLFLFVFNGKKRGQLRYKGAQYNYESQLEQAVSRIGLHLGYTLAFCLIMFICYAVYIGVRGLL